MATGGGGGLTVPDVGHQRADSQGDLEEATTGPRRIRQHAEPSQPVTIGLDQDLAWLWGKFLPLPNEMVVNRPGRRMFPVVSVSVSGLRPEAMYTVYLDMILVDNHRWKYVRGEWMVGGKADPPHPTIYKHHDSPHYGSHWMKSPIVFNKVKLTNKPGDGGHLVLNSLHKYQARVHIVPEQGQRLEPLPCSWKSFPETQFIAVTAYQNDAVTQLKIKYNPYARAFTEANKKTSNVGVMEVPYQDQTFQPLMARRFSAGPDEEEAMSESEEMPDQQAGYEFEAALPDQTASAAPSMKRDADMDVEVYFPNSRSMPPTGIPSVPSTYSVTGRDGQVMFFGPGGRVLVDKVVDSPQTGRQDYEATLSPEDAYRMQYAHSPSSQCPTEPQSPQHLPRQEPTPKVPCVDGTQKSHSLPLPSAGQGPNMRFQYCTSPKSPPHNLTYATQQGQSHQLSPQQHPLSPPSFDNGMYTAPRNPTSPTQPFLVNHQSGMNFPTQLHSSADGNSFPVSPDQGNPYRQLLLAPDTQQPPGAVNRYATLENQPRQLVTATGSRNTL